MVYQKNACVQLLKRNTFMPRERYYHLGVESYLVIGHVDYKESNGTKYSRMDQVKFVEDSL